jgi:hypothetical protein
MGSDGGIIAELITGCTSSYRISIFVMMQSPKMICKEPVRAMFGRCLREPGLFGTLQSPVLEVITFQHWQSQLVIDCPVAGRKLQTHA